MGFTIERKSEFVLYTHYHSNYVLSFLLLGVSLIFIAVFLVSYPQGIFLAFIFFGIGIYGILSERELSCLINIHTGIISYTRGGVLNSQYDSENTQYQISEIKALEMKRHVGSGERDTFQIRLALSTNRQLNLSSANLGFTECQQLASQIHQFIGVDKPLTAVD